MIVIEYRVIRIIYYSSYDYYDYFDLLIFDEVVRDYFLNTSCDPEYASSFLTRSICFSQLKLHNLVDCEEKSGGATVQVKEEEALTVRTYYYYCIYYRFTPNSSCRYKYSF